MTLQPDTPQNLSEFLSITKALDDYEMTERDIARAAYLGMIKLYFYWYEEMKPFPPCEIEEYLIFRKITVGIMTTKIKGSWIFDNSKGSLVYEDKSNPPTAEEKTYTKNDIFINIPELETALNLG